MVVCSDPIIIEEQTDPPKMSKSRGPTFFVLGLSWAISIQPHPLKGVSQKGRTT